MQNYELFGKISFDNLPKAIEEIYKEIFSMSYQLQELKLNFEPKKPDEYLTRRELAAFLKCDISTIDNWTHKGKLIPYGIGNRVYFKRSDIETCLLPFGKNRGHQ